jgi:flagellar motility protein MotE (MotC chaperone)
MAQRQKRAALGGVSLIVLCFVGSAALRFGESGLAVAEEIVDRAGLPAAPPGDALLAAVRAREGDLDTREKTLADRAQALNVAEAKLAEQLAAFEKARSQLEGTLATADKAAEKDIDRMTTVYEKMKPADAARILDKMDVAFAAGLLGRMRPEIAAQVLAGMSAEAAYAVTVTVASRNSRVPTR